MLFASALVTGAEIDAQTGHDDNTAEGAANALLAPLATQLQDQQPDFVALFFSSHHNADAAAIARAVRNKLRPRVLIGCSAESLIADDVELEHQNGISILAGALPNVRLTPFALSARHLSEWSTILSDKLLFSEALGAPDDAKAFILLADPFSTPVDAAGELGIGVLQAFNAFFPGIPVIGGVASGGSYPGSNLLLCNDISAQEGIVGVAISGDVGIDVIVSQGCRPIGRAYSVTSARQSMILSLDGERPMNMLQQMVDELGPDDRELLLTGGLYIGRAVRRVYDTDETLGRGDFLIRGVMGNDSRTGALIIGDTVDIGEMVQFHVRDARTAEEDLDMALMPQAFSEAPAGALLFTCNGRGTHLYKLPNGDTSIIQRVLGGDQRPLPMAGLFCSGEIGPIGSRAYLHGHTASLVLFRPA
jgi:small ligand-binding sensory domain FIST